MTADTITLEIPIFDLTEFLTASGEQRLTLAAWIRNACYAAIARRAVQRMAVQAPVPTVAKGSEAVRFEAPLCERVEISLPDSDITEFTNAAMADGDDSLTHWIIRQCYAADAPRRLIRDRHAEKLDGPAFGHALQAVVDLGHPPKDREDN